MRIALTTWQNRISPVFDVSREITICETDGPEERQMRTAPLAPPDPSEKARQLEEYGVEWLICGAISRCAAEMLRARGIEVTPFIAGPADVILEACLDGSLNAADWAMPGCRRGRGGGGRRRRRGRGRCRFD